MTTANRRSPLRRYNGVFAAPIERCFRNRTELAALADQHIFRAPQALFVESVLDDASSGSPLQ
jgi:hypothetical protein